MDTREFTKEYRMSHWAKIIKEQKESGLSAKSYCANSGIRENQFYYWQKKLREAACEELMKVQGTPSKLAPSGFIEVKPPLRSALSPTTSNHGQLSVETSEIRITAGGDYPMDKLIAVLREVTR